MTYGEQKKDTNRHWQLSLGTVIIHLHMLISYGAQAARKLVSFQVLLLNSITKRVKKFRHKRKDCSKKWINQGENGEIPICFYGDSGNINYRVERKSLKTST